MSETDHPSASPAPLPEAQVQRRASLSLIWLIPLVAALIAGWLAWKAYSEAGPEIAIRFASAAGLEAGRTKVRYKNVEIGEVSEIHLSEDLSGVVVRATLGQDAERFLTRNTRFWVERARVSAGQVSGIETVLGGAYIAIDPVLEGAPAREFQGLESPPVVTTDQAGRHFRLQASRLGSLQVGSPVYFKDIPVGEVSSQQLEPSGESLSLQIFVRAPHHQGINRQTRFWNASGLNLSLGASGLSLDTPSLSSLLIGGISFANPPGVEDAVAAPADSEFILHPNRGRAFEHGGERTRWLVHFSGSVRGLAVGAPVEFRGIQLGEVVDLRLEMDLDRVAFRIPVIIEIDPERLALSGTAADLMGINGNDARRSLWDTLVAGGLRAQLKTGNLVTGALFIDLDIHDDLAEQRIDWEALPHPELPAIPTPLEELRNVLTGALRKFEQMSFEQMGADLEQSLAALRETSQQIQTLVVSLNTTLIPGLDATLSQTRSTLVSAERTLAGADQTLAPNSPLQREAQQVMRELAAAARSLRNFADYLERHPEALIQGK